ncbi:MAG TPA: iron-containing alcohol dehydrogenase [Sphingobium sp.]|nr:iron-containing alcohol dehydrogenase [Sphingobium sp.]
MAYLGATRAPRNIIFGEGQRRALGAVARSLGSRIFVVTDARMSGDRNFTDLMDNLVQNGLHVTIFDEAQPELPIICIDQCVAAAKTAAPDMIFGIGGGSCMDLAKATALMLAHGGDIRDYFGEFKVPGPTIPLILMPTTAGTSSEVTPIAVLSHPDKAVKVGISSPFILAHTAICDPELTYGTPASLTAIAGADALTHAIEAFTAVRRPADPELTNKRVFIGKNALSDHHAIEAIRRISRNLPRLCGQDDDPEARSEVMFGTLLAGLAFGTAGTAAAHAIQYPIGALTHTAHGLGVALLMPYVMDFNRSHRIAEMAQIAVAMGEADQGRSPDDLAFAAIGRVASLMSAIGIPRTLADIGIVAEQLPSIAEQSIAIERLVLNNPRPIDLPGMNEIVNNAFNGKYSNASV